MKLFKGKKIQTIALSFVLMLTFVLGTGIAAYADTTEITSDMHIRGHQYNSYSANSSTRTTTKSNNAWRVDLTKSSETQGTVTSFWLVKSSATGTGLSKKIDVKKGSGWNDCVPYADANSASGIGVKIAAENNTWNTETYDITCKWVAQAS